MKIGFAKECITPEFPVYLSGYAAERRSTEKLDDLYVKVVVAQKDGELFGIFNYDLLAVDHLIMDEMKNAIRDHGWKEENFLFAATHTHSGPGGIVETRNGLLRPAEEIFIKTDLLLIHYIVKQSIMALEEAVADQKEAVLYYAQDTLAHVGDNRNSRQFKGNNDLAAVFIEQEEGKKAVLLNFACHPTILNGANTKISADFPGAIQRVMQDRGYDMSMFLNGSCGDISTRFSRQGADEKEVLRYGCMFEDKLTEMRRHARIISIDDLRCRHMVKTLELKKADRIDHAQKELDACMKRLEEARANGVSGSDLRLIESYKEGADANLRLAKYAFAIERCDVNIMFMKVNDHIIVCVPGELFSELSNPLQNEQVHFIGYANGYMGYFADEAAYDNFCYEALSSPFKKGQSEMMMAFIAQEINTLLGKETNMTTVAKQYLEYVADILKNTMDTQEEALDQAAELVCRSCEDGGRFYVFGSGHSHMIAEEIYIRAGGLAYVKAILPPELMLHEMPNKSTWLERLDGYAEAILKLYKVDAKDTIMIISNSGRNPVPVEMAIAAKKLGAKVIAMTSMQHSTQTTSRHKSGKKLYELADVILDNGAKKGDAAFVIEGLDTPTGPTSDAIGIALAQALIASVIDKLVRHGQQPPVFKSSNVDGADDYNDALFDTYYGYWK